MCAHQDNTAIHCYWSQANLKWYNIIYFHPYYHIINGYLVYHHHLEGFVCVLYMSRHRMKFLLHESPVHIHVSKEWRYRSVSGESHCTLVGGFPPPSQATPTHVLSKLEQTNWKMNVGRVYSTAVHWKCTWQAIFPIVKGGCCWSAGQGGWVPSLKALASLALSIFQL